MDLVKLESEIEKINKETIPALQDAIHAELKFFLDGLNKAIDRLEGLKVVGTIEVPK